MYHYWFSDSCPDSYPLLLSALSYWLSCLCDKWCMSFVIFNPAQDTLPGSYVLFAGTIDMNYYLQTKRQKMSINTVMTQNLWGNTDAYQIMVIDDHYCVLLCLNTHTHTHTNMHTHTYTHLVQFTWNVWKSLVANGAWNLTWLANTMRTDGVLTGFIRVIVVGLLLLLGWRRLLPGLRSTVGSGLPPLFSRCRRRPLLWRSCTRGVRSHVSSHRACSHIQSFQGCTKWHHFSGQIRTVSLSPCWTGGLELWTGTIFFITTGLPCPASSGPAPPVAIRGNDGLGATGG